MSDQSSFFLRSWTADDSDLWSMTDTLVRQRTAAAGRKSPTYMSQQILQEQLPRFLQLQGALCKFVVLFVFQDDVDSFRLQDLTFVLSTAGHRGGGGDLVDFLSRLTDEERTCLFQHFRQPFYEDWNTLVMYSFLRTVQCMFSIGALYDMGMTSEEVKVVEETEHIGDKFQDNRTAEFIRALSTEWQQKLIKWYNDMLQKGEDYVMDGPISISRNRVFWMNFK